MKPFETYEDINVSGLGPVELELLVPTLVYSESQATDGCTRCTNCVYRINAETIINLWYSAQTQARINRLLKVLDARVKSVILKKALKYLLLSDQGKTSQFSMFRGYWYAVGEPEKFGQLTHNTQQRIFNDHWAIRDWWYEENNNGK